MRLMRSGFDWLNSMRLVLRFARSVLMEVHSFLD